MSSPEEPQVLSSSEGGGGGVKRKEPAATAAPSFTPQDDWQLVSQGAEARLWKIPRNSSTSPSFLQQQQQHNDNKDDNDPHIMAKERFSKKYRHPVLDERLTKQRCRMEGRLLEKCRQNGLAVPRVWRVQAPVLYMEYIDGMTVRNILQEWIESSSPSSCDKEEEEEKTVLSASVQAQVNQMGQVMGTLIGQLHGLGMIHGDLTTSNMMIRGRGTNFDNNPTILLIDFGLAKNSQSEEDRAVDLYVLERALSSTHPSLPESFMDDVILVAYAKVAPKADKVMQRLEQVRLRGRKRECFG